MIKIEHLNKSFGTFQVLKDISVEYEPGKGLEPYYPVLTDQSKELYATYKGMAESICNLSFCGRLADFRYYNMDQALRRALDLAGTL